LTHAIAEIDWEADDYSADEEDAERERLKNRKFTGKKRRISSNVHIWRFMRRILGNL
jgi:hypothetical protein